MDHLPLIGGAVDQLTTVPHLVNSRFSYTSPIESFLERCRSPTPTGGDASYSSFIQQWLYFGLLIDFFSIWGFSVPQSDFTVEKNGKQVITNQLLLDYAMAYLAREFNQDQSLLRDRRPTNLLDTYTPSEKGQANQRMKRGLVIFHFVHDTLSSVVEKEAVDSAVWDSIVLLSSYLARFWQNVYGSLRPESAAVDPPTFADFPFRKITDFRTSNGYCPHEKRLLLDLTDSRPNDIAFISRVRVDEGDVSHQGCSSSECIAYQVDLSAPYHTMHTKNCDGGCTFVGLGHEILWRDTENKMHDQEYKKSSFVNQMKDALPDKFKKEVIAVTFEEDNQLHYNKVSLVKSDLAGGVKFDIGNWNMIAFSHVWADGLGNKESNTMPVCQLKRLQSLANDVYPTRKRNIPFWIDTLLIPVTDEASSPKEKEAKIEALRDMEWVYKYASKVLVLDKRLFSTPSEPMEAEEIGARIMLSTWSRRLWTLQEGCSRDRTYFRFKDRWINWPDLHKRVLDRGGLSNWRDKGSKLPKNHPLRKAQKLSLYRHKKGTTRATAGLSGAAGDSTTSPRIKAAMSGDAHVHKVTSSCWHTTYRFLEEMTIDWSGRGRGEALTWCIRGMYYRNCSKIGDEPLVLASMLSAAPGSAAELTRKGKNNSADGYAALLETLDYVPEELLFLDQERYPLPGRRWMPKSLLSVKSTSYRPPARTDKLPKAHGYTPWGAIRSNMSKRSEQGITVALRGLKLLPSPRALQAPFRFQWENYKGSSWMKTDPEYFRASVKQPGTSHFESTLEEAEWVLIMERIAAYSDDWRQCHAALVQVTKWNDSWYEFPGGAAKFVALAIVNRVDKYEFETSALPEVRTEEPHKLHKYIRPLGDRQGPVQGWCVG